MIIQIQPWIDESELEQLKRVVDSTFVTEAGLTAEFEEMTRTLTGSTHAHAVTNGTTALFCCLKALNIGPGDEVIVPNITFIASANAVIMAGAKPVFCEVDENTFCLDVHRATSLVTDKTRAVMPVHLYGQAADMDLILPFAATHGLAVIEDAAQGVGVRFNDRHTGTIGDMGILSYYGNKTITSGEGGMVLTDNPDLAQSVFRLKNHGRDTKGTFIHEHIGFNFSFTDIQAAIGIAQMHKLPAIIARKKAINDRYRNEINADADFSHVTIDDRCDPVHWFTSLLVPDAEKLEAQLKQRDIQSRRFFYPLHLQPCYTDLIDTTQDYSLSESIYQRGLSLPSSVIMTDDEQTQVIDTLNALL
jgi:perosamine synthetase